MDLDGARVVVAGATGELGGALVSALIDKGARVVPGGRDEEQLSALGEQCGTEPVRFDAVDVESCREAMDAAAGQLDGLDAIVVTVGCAGFGKALDTDAAVTEELFAVNTLAPISLVRAAAPHLSDDGTVAVFSAILADMPTNGMADYSAAKSALSVWLQVLRRENRKKLRVLDIRPPHLDTGLEQRAMGAEPPKMPKPMEASKVVDQVIEALAGDAMEIKMSDGELTTS